jgi:hypothetical protein
MTRRMTKIALTAAGLTTATTAILATATATATATPATAARATVASASLTASAPLTKAHVAVHFDLASGQQPENIAQTATGSYVTFAVSRQIARISPRGRTTVLATLPLPADGGVNTPAVGFPLTTGIVRAQDGTLYVGYATGTADLTGIWRLRPGGTPTRIVALPATGLPNGLVLDRRSDTLYVTDSVLGTIYRVPAHGGRATAWSTAPELAAQGFVGANGLKLHGGALWASNLDRGTVLRIPFTRDGRAGAVQTTATGLVGIDDFAFTGHGDTLLAAINPSNTVELVNRNGSHSVVLDAGDGLQNPTSIAVRGRTVTVLSAAYQTQKDPNFLVARLGRG